MEGKKLLISIPAYNEEPAIGKVLEAIPKQFDGIREHEVLVVNDGSTDKTEEVAKNYGATVISHPLNIGLGGAIQTAQEYALENNFDVWVTLDADGQHDPKDISLIIDPIITNKAHVVIGKREFSIKNTPPIRIFGNKFLSLVTFLFSGVKTSDSQSGFRAFSNLAARQIELKLWGWEHNSEVIMEVGKRKLMICEVPIPSLYTKYSVKKGQSVLNGINILMTLLNRR